MIRCVVCLLRLGAAIEHSLPLEWVSHETFRLPTLGDKLRKLAEELTSGIGLFQIRGLDPQKYSSETNVILYLGISSYVGQVRGRQDEYGNMLRTSLLNHRRVLVSNTSNSTSDRFGIC